MEKTYKIKYMIQTSSRCGKYNYVEIETVEGESREAAVENLRTKVASETSFKRYKFRILGIKEQ